MPITNRHIKLAVKYYLDRYDPDYSHLQGDGIVFFYLDALGNAQRIGIQKQGNNILSLYGKQSIGAVDILVDKDRMYHIQSSLRGYQYIPIF